MRLPSWLRPFAIHLNPVRKQRTRSRRGFRPRLESLEDRITPSAAVISDLNPSGTGVSLSAGSSAVLNGTAYFIAQDGAAEYHLWKSDGTSAGTVPVMNFGSPYTQALDLKAVNGRLVFDVNTYDPSLGHSTDSLWVSDGTTAGTVPLAATPAGGFSLGDSVVVGNELYFGGSDGIHGQELWKTDGTEAGTVMVKDLNPGSADGDPNQFMAFGSKVLFSAHDGSNTNPGIWVSDGTAAGTMEIIGNTIGELTGGGVLNGSLYFGAQTPTQAGFWKTDGTTAGTVEVEANFRPVGTMITYNGALLFEGEEVEGGPLFTPLDLGLFRSDGTASGTVNIQDGMEDIYPAVVYDGAVLFSGTPPFGHQVLYKTDGTAAGTVLVKDINPNLDPSQYLNQFDDFTNVNGRLFFIADDDTHGKEIWSSDGTTLGTFLAQDINPGSASSDPSDLMSLGNNLLFLANDGVHGVELWSSAGNQAPVASATPLTQTVPEGALAQFDASASYDPDGDVLTYLWDFNGDGEFDASGAQVSHAFGAAGVYPVTLEVIDGFGLSSTTTVDVTVTEVEPTAIITNDTPLATDASGNLTSPEGSPISLGGSLTDPGWLDLLSGVTFTWNVTKNGAAYQSGTGQQYWFTPDDNGTYVVTLEVTDQDGSGSVSQTIDVTTVAPTVHIRTPAGLTPKPAWALDPNFGAGGQLSIETTGYNIQGSVVAQQPDGKIVTAGYDFQNSYLDIARYLPDGTPDPSFGQNGVVVTDLGHTDTTVGSPSVLLVQPDGKILIDVTSNYGMYLLRLNPDGTLDTSFGTANTGIVDLPLTFAPSAVALQGDNILVGGTGDGNSFVVDRFTAAGALDTTFGTDGTATVQLQYPGIQDFSGLTAVAVQGGQIYLAGSLVARSDVGPLGDFFAVAKLDANGNLDTSYGGAAPPDPNGRTWNTYNRLATPGWAFTGDASFDEDYPTAILVQSDGQALLDGSNGLYQVSADGLTGVQVGSGVPNLIAQPDGKQLVASISYDPTSGSTLTLTRLNPDLTPDTTFGPNGDGQVITNLDLDPSINPSLDSILVQSDGNVLVAMDLYDANNNYVGSSLTRILGQATPGQVIHEGDTVTLTGTAFDPAAAEEPTLAYAWSVTKDGAAYQTATGTTYQFTPTDNGTYVVTLTVTDQGGGSSTDSRTFTVVNVPPTAGVTGPGTAVAGQVLSYTLSATDPSPVDEAAGFTYTVDWGDGTSGTPDVQTFAASAGNGTGLSVTHAYAAAGSYTVLVTATDKDGGVSTAISTAVQVNAVTAANVQQQLTSGGTVTVQTTTPQQAQDIIAAANSLDPATTPTSTLVVDLGGQTIQDTIMNVPPQVTLQFVNGTFIGGSPALIVNSGVVIVKNSTFINATDAPTILVTGGSLILRDDTIQESTGYSDAAIEVTGGTVDLGAATDPGGNTININGAGAFALNTTSTPIAAVGDTFTVNGLPLTPSTLSGTVFEDFNDDGQIDFGEEGIANVLITLTGTDDLGDAVSQSQRTDSDGAYVFLNLRPGNYTITETQPSGYAQGIDSAGTAGGTLSATDQFFVNLAPEVSGLNYNFGEQPAGAGPVTKGQSAGIGFWNNKNGQALILAFNGGAGTQLADWLAATLPNMFGANAGSNDLAGKNNAYVAALFQSDFVVKGTKLDAQVLATALSVYATNATLDSTGVAAKYGFVVSGDGVGAAAWNVGSSGDAFGVANNTTMTVMDLLLATDAQAIDGLLYNGNTTKRNEANAVYSAISEAGSIS